MTITFRCRPEDDDSIGKMVKEELESLLSNSNETLNGAYTSLIHKTEIEPNQWKDSVAHAIQSLQNKELEKVVLARKQRLTYEQTVDDAQVLSALDQEQPGSYIFSLNWVDSSFVGATPERLVIKNNEIVESTCLAGSIGIGKTDQETKELGDWLLQDKKNTEEHQYVVQHITKTFEKLCEAVEIDEKPKLLKMRHIQHLFTGVKGRVPHHVSLLDFVESLHPTPALGGTPRTAALQVIRELEPMDRGYYAAPLGWCDFDDNGEFVVGLRSGLIQNKMVTLFAGCGVVASSEPEKEFEETSIKFKPMLSALGGMRN